MHGNSASRWARAHACLIANSIVSLAIIAGNLAFFAIAMKAFIQNLDNMDVHAQFVHQPPPDTAARKAHEKYWSYVLDNAVIVRIGLSLITTIYAALLAATAECLAGTLVCFCLLMYWFVSMLCAVFLSDGHPYRLTVGGPEGHEKVHLLVSLEAVLRWRAVMDLLFCVLDLMVFCCVCSWRLGRRSKRDQDEVGEVEESGWTILQTETVSLSTAPNSVAAPLPARDDPSKLSWVAREGTALQRDWATSSAPQLEHMHMDPVRSREEGHESAWSAETAVS